DFQNGNWTWELPKVANENNTSGVALDLAATWSLDDYSHCCSARGRSDPFQKTRRSKAVDISVTFHIHARPSICNRYYKDNLSVPRSEERRVGKESMAW